MQQLNEHHAFTGMQKDKDMLRHPSSFLYDAKNIRLDARFNKSNLQIISNEKGNTRTEIQLKGNYLGHAIINQYLIIFSHSTKIEDREKPDSILRVDLAAENINDTANSCKTLYNGNLKFSENNKIQTLSDYENEKIQKVYWVDGINPARVINIVSDKIRESEDTQFDFSRELKLQEEVTIRKNTEGTHGNFPNGVIQYALTYYSNTGVESAIFYTSPLLYITEDNTRGGSPESKSFNTFTIKVKNPDTSFDYCRIYSLIRTSLNGDVIAKKVTDIFLEGTEEEIKYIDTNYTGEAVEAQSLLYKGSKNVIGQTIAAKDGTLFMGNLFLPEFVITDEVRNKFKINSGGSNNVTLESSLRKIYSAKVTDIKCSEYLYANQLTAYSDDKLTASTPCGGFKYGNYYRCGLQFQDVFGNWSEPVWVDDYQETYQPKSTFIKDGILQVDLPTIVAKLSPNLFQDSDLKASGFFDYYKKVRPVVVFPQPQDRVVVCQGVAANTLWSDTSVTNEECYPDWFFSSVGSDKGKYTTENVAEADKVIIVSSLKWKGDRKKYPTLENPAFYPTLSHVYRTRLAGIRGNTYFPLVLGSGINEKNLLIYDNDSIRTGVNTNIIIERDVQALEMQHVSYDDWCWRSNRVINIYSPDIEFDFNTYFSQDDSLADLVYKHVGMATIANTFSNIDIQRNNDGISSKSYFDGSYGQHTYTGGFGVSTGYYFWETPVGRNGSTNVSIKFNPGGNSNDPDAIMCWPVYLWQRKGSLINDTFNGDSPYADLKEKQILNIRYANTKYYTNPSLEDVKFSKIYLCNNLVYDKLKGTVSTFNKIVNYSYSTVDAYGYLTLVNFRERTQQCTGGEYIWPKMPFSLTWDNRQRGGKETFENFNLGHIHNCFSIYNDPFSLVRLYNGEIRAACYRHEVFDLGTFSEYPQSFAGSFLLKPGTYHSKGLYYMYPEIKILKYLQTEGTKTETQVVPVTYKTCNCLFLHWTDREDEKDDVSLLEGFKDPALNITEIRVPGEGIEGRPDYRSTMFGGTLKAALLQNSWIPCGEPVDLKENAVIEYSYGDTYYQRWDCVKTNARSKDDINQLVEIGSFMLETYVNIDGRWDRNRGTNDKAYISEAFNSVNEVYSQHNNFFSYRILNDTNYSENLPTQFTWTKEKQPTADIDSWTNFTLASTYNVEGSKGPIVALVKNKDRLYCFQEKGISVILFNSRVQIPVSDGVPIEIANNYKVDGVQYLSDGVGCSDKFLIANTPTGIYFIDSVTKHLFHLGETLRDLTTTCGMSSWFDDNNRVNGEVIGGNHIPIKLLYDELYKDVYVVYYNTCLCYSEKFGQFISFYDYPAMPLLEHYNNKVYTLGGIRGHIQPNMLPDDAQNRLYIMFDGEYNSIYPFKDNLGVLHPNYKEWSFTLIGNGSDSGLQDTEKIFTNLDYRVDTLNVKKDNGEIDYTMYDFDAILSKITVSNEYQTATQKLQRLKNELNNKSYHHKDANLQRKNRIWRIQLPTEKDIHNNNNGRYMYRIRGPWCKVSLTGRAENKQVALYDLNLQYYI